MRLQLYMAQLEKAAAELLKLTGEVVGLLIPLRIVECDYTVQSN